VGVFRRSCLTERARQTAYLPWLRRVCGSFYSFPVAALGRRACIRPLAYPEARSRQRSRAHADTRHNHCTRSRHTRLSAPAQERLPAGPSRPGRTRKRSRPIFFA